LGARSSVGPAQQELGAVNHLLVDDQQRQVASIVIGRGKKAQFVDWAQITGFGPDAVMVTDESSLRGPADDRERAASEGKLELVDKPLTWAFGGGDGIRTHGLYIAKVRLLSVLTRPFPRTFLVAAFRSPQVPSRSLSFPLDKDT
jgi:hypothetical protein